jgi:predicted phosphodiesterase
VRGIISDLHGNAEALEAVFQDMDRKGVDEIFCLGDVVGYGPDPEHCIDRVMERCKVVICGNHDWAVVHGAVGFNRVAKGAIDATRKRLKPGLLASAEKRRRWDFIQNLEQSYRDGDDLFVHGSPRDPTMEYVFPYDIMVRPNVKIEEIFAMFGRTCFSGHTHVPGILTEGYEFLDIITLEGEYHRTDEKTLINVGSVGQPRDGDNRACYVTIDGDDIAFHRVEYDYARTIRKIQETRDIDELCGLRLERGE